MARRLIVRVSMLLGLLLAASLMALSSVAADELVQAEPPADGVTAETPHNLLLTFDRGLAQLRNAHTVEVLDESGERIDTGHASVSTYSLRTLVVPLSGESEGEIEVRYTVLFEQDDGNVREVSGSYSFAVNPLAPGEAGVAQLATAPKSKQGLVLWTIAVLIGVALVGAMLYFLRLATGNARSSLEPRNRTPFED